jgi:uncharacterized membrane protein YkvA (DUF1232 family)
MNRIKVVFRGQYTPATFWGKVRRFGGALGRGSLHVVFTLYHCLQDPDTPAWARTTIVAALGYFILPADLVPDIIPGAGLADDAAALASALAITAAHVKQEHRDRAKKLVEEWFGRRA